MIESIQLIFSVPTLRIIEMLFLVYKYFWTFEVASSSCLYLPKPKMLKTVVFLSLIFYVNYVSMQYTYHYEMNANEGFILLTQLPQLNFFIRLTVNEKQQDHRIPMLTPTPL